ncbi:ATPase, partial [Candidatus Acetothermia bacterium]|nr:ATPase [Candidatus Acetothermia bacterium]
MSDRSSEELIDLQIDPDIRAKIATAAQVALDSPAPLVMDIVDRGTVILAARTLKVIEKVGPVDSVYVYGGNFHSQVYCNFFIQHLHGLRVNL